MLDKLKAISYFVLDLATLKKGIMVGINDYKFRLPIRYHKYFPADYEHDNFSFFKRICTPGMNCIDIGAHIGLFSIYMQKLSGGHVFSFEPTPSTVSVLKKTITLNKVTANIEVVAAAVSDKTGKGRLCIDTQAASVSNSLVQYERTANLETCEVELVTLDEFVKQRNIKIKFIKIDAEGAELAVLKGAYNTVDNQRPFMVLGLHPAAIAARGETNEMIWQVLKKMKYSVLYDGKEITQNEFCDKKEIFDVHLLPMEQKSI
jgi:FkbM family methyltransferase